MRQFQEKVQGRFGAVEDGRRRDRDPPPQTKKKIERGGGKVVEEWLKRCMAQLQLVADVEGLSNLWWRCRSWWFGRSGTGGGSEEKGGNSGWHDSQ